MGGFKAITYSSKPHGCGRLIISVERDLLISVFGAPPGDDGVFDTFSQHVSFFTWLARERVADRESGCAVIDMTTFRAAQMCAIADAENAAATRPVAYAREAARAERCLHETKNEDGSYNPLAAAAMLCILAAGECSHSTSEVTQAEARHVIYDLFLQRLGTSPRTGQ